METKISPVLNGPWDLSAIGRFAESAVIPVRLSAIHPEGYPVVASLWFLYDEGRLVCACRESAAIVGLLRENPVCGFEIAGEKPPYYGIRGHGVATIDKKEGAAALKRLIERYLGQGDSEFRRWLLDGADKEVAIVITPERIMSWDYRKRMSA